MICPLRVFGICCSKSLYLRLNRVGVAFRKGRPKRFRHRRKPFHGWRAKISLTTEIVDFRLNLKFSR